MLHKNLGPLIAAEEMTRCIHCTRCVRFGQEIAGVMELGMIGRGEHAEIVTFVGKTVDSELSGNMIDLCPVGALTSKPFRYTARDLGAVAPQVGAARTTALGANLIVQVKNDRVMRVLPLENEAVNECWLSDRDRFSYEGLNSRRAPDRADDQAGRPLARGRLADGARVRRRAASKRIVGSTAPRRSARWRRRTRRSRRCTCCRSWCAAWAATTSTSACASPTSRADGKLRRRARGSA